MKHRWSLPGVDIRWTYRTRVPDILLLQYTDVAWLVSLKA